MSLRVRRTLKIVTVLSLCLGCLLMLAPPAVEACNPPGFTKKLAKALAAGDIVKACRIIKRWLDKLTGVPLPPIPGMPTAAQCAMLGEDVDDDAGGRGRGGGMGGGGSPGGGSDGLVYIFNSASPTGCYTYTITPDAGNPPGFSLVGGAGVVNVPLGGIATVPFTVNIGAAVPVGTMALFHVKIIDCGNNKPLPDNFELVKVTALNQLRVDITQVNFGVVDGAPATARWKVSNLSPAPRVVNFTFGVIDDPGSLAELNNGATIPVHDTFSDPRSAMGGGAMNLDAAGGMNDNDEIVWDMEPGQYCEPGMLGCCTLILDGVTVGDQCFVNTANVGARCCMPADTYYVRGTSTGGNMTVDVSGQPLTVPIGAGVPTLDIVDTLTNAINNHANVTDNYNFNAVSLAEELMVMYSGLLPTFSNLVSGDPGVIAVKLPQFMPLDTFDTLPHPMNPRALRSRLPLTPIPDLIEIELNSLNLVAVPPPPINNTNVMVLSANDVAALRNTRGAAVPIMPPGFVFGAQADFNLATPTTPPIQINGPIQVELAPLLLGDQSFNVRVPVSIGLPTRIQAIYWLNVRPTASNGPNTVPVQLQPPTIQAMQTGPTQFRIQYQAQTPIQTFAVNNEFVTVLGAILVPSLCNFELGDLNHDLLVDGHDIDEMTAAIIGGATAQQVPCAEFLSDGFINSGDVPGFVNALLN